MRPAISHVAIFVLFAAYRLFFAIADDIDSRCLNALLYEKFLRGVCTAVAKTKVVFARAALVTMPFDGERTSRFAAGMPRSSGAGTSHPTGCRLCRNQKTSSTFCGKDRPCARPVLLVAWRSRWRWHGRNIDGHTRAVSVASPPARWPWLISDRCWRVHRAVTCGRTAPSPGSI